MSVRAAVGVRLGTLDLDVELSVDTNEVVAVVGPNGAGKTTLLRALAGLVPLASGRVVLDGTTVEDTADGVRVPAERRPVGYVFQDHLLFPHLSCLDNVAFGLRARGVGRRAARVVAGEWLARLGLDGVAGDRPAALSGGQGQRVALARALAIGPSVLLLDEPLAALDASARLDVRAELRRQLGSHEGTRLVVTHDPIDAMVLADRMVVIEAGRIVQEGTALEISRRPRSPYVARLVGLNLYRGQRDGATIRLEEGGELVGGSTPAAPGAVFVAVRPQAVALFRERSAGTPRNLWPGTVAAVEVIGDRARVAVQAVPAVVAEVTVAAVAELALHPGATVWASVKATEVEVYPR